MTDLDFPSFDDSHELCCGRKKACPIITKTDEGFTLSDKGHVISMNDAQAAELIQFLQAKLA